MKLLRAIQSLHPSWLSGKECFGNRSKLFKPTIVYNAGLDDNHVRAQGSLGPHSRTASPAKIAIDWVATSTYCFIRRRFARDDFESRFINDPIYAVRRTSGLLAVVTVAYSLSSRLS